MHYLRLQRSRTGVRTWSNRACAAGRKSYNERVKRSISTTGTTWGDETQSKRGRGMDLLLEQWLHFPSIIPTISSLPFRHCRWSSSTTAIRYFPWASWSTVPGPFICGSEFVHSEGAEQILRRCFFLTYSYLTRC